ncbi:putative lysyl-tRNA synthetase [Rosellinia necatrix]|uniref:Lysyl-tRNA synthetase n=1 Tax=Rosellinia necatrix TaxID=77044 RepID=A0A1S7UMM0_ROSNE|nr:putative lysyl-tRNA synthetase [Rosellinia necatrix]
MESALCLRFLRPYLFGLPPADRAAYGRLFSTSRTKSNCQSRPCAIGQRRAFHSSQIRQSASTVPSNTEDAPETAAIRAVSVAGRAQKLRDYDALRFPRLEHRANRMTIPAFRQMFEDEASTPASEHVTLEGRVMAVRQVGSKLVFLHILGGYQQVQVMVHLGGLASPPDPEVFRRALHPLRRGDFISVTGTAVRTKSGELTLGARELPIIVSPALAPLPKILINEETKILNRHVDSLVNQRTSDIIRLRSQIVKSMRDFFHERDFLEVQTPILADSAGGATARPFLTAATAFPAKQLSMRIAPELWLKRLVVGGNDRIFEIGPSFRNEGLDTTHNPEFTTCEFYSAYFNLAELIRTTESLITRLLSDVNQAIETRLTSLQTPQVSIPDGQWKQVEFIPALEDILGFQFPDLSKPDALKKLASLLPKHHASAIKEASLNKLLDHLAATHLENASLDQPLFIINHPACMAPLSKSFTCPKTGQLVSARAELFIEGREIANMYEEENDPFEQRRKFELQIQSRGSSTVADEEGPAEIDESYVQALEYGLPPTGGWGCGVDRLVMFLSGASKISDTLPFGNLRNVVSLSQDAKDL